MQVTNTFEGGMIIDSDYSSLSNNSYLYAENFRITGNNGDNSKLLESVMGNARASILYTDDKNNIKFIGSCYIRDICYVFAVDTTQKLINPNNPVDSFIYAINTNYIYQIYSDVGKSTKLNFNYNDDLVNNYQRVNAVGRYENETTQKLYIVDGKNQLRVINVADPMLNSYDPLAFTISLTINSANYVFPSNLTSGKLKCGNYQYCIQYVGINGAVSKYHAFSTVFTIKDRNSIVYYDKTLFSNNPTTDNTNSSPLTVNNVEMSPVNPYNDINYGGGTYHIVTGTIGNDSGFGVRLKVPIEGDKKLVRLIKLYYGDTHIPEISLIYETNIQNNSNYYIEYTDTGIDFINYITLDDLTLNTSSSIIAGLIATKKDYLFLGDLKTTTFDVNYDARAYRYFSNNAYTYGGRDYARTSILTTNISNPIRTADNKIILSAKGDNWATHTLQTVPATHNCVNNYNYYYNQNNTLTDDVNALEYEMVYQSNGLTQGGTGINISYHFSNGPKPFSIDAYKTIGSNTYSTTGSFKFGQLMPFPLYDTESSLIQDLEYLLEADQFMKGFKQDEVYRFAVVFLDQYGNESSAKWIGDIRFPLSSFTTNGDNQELLPNVMGIKFTFSNLSSLSNQGVKYIKIVRADRLDNDKQVIDSGIIGSIGLNPINPFITGNKVKYSNLEGIGLTVNYNGTNYTNSNDYLSLISYKTVENIDNSQIIYDKLKISHRVVTGYNIHLIHFKNGLNRSNINYPASYTPSTTYTTFNINLIDYTKSNPQPHHNEFGGYGTGWITVLGEYYPIVNNEYNAIYNDNPTYYVKENEIISLPNNVSFVNIIYNNGTGIVNNYQNYFYNNGVNGTLSKTVSYKVYSISAGRRITKISDSLKNYLISSNNIDYEYNNINTNQYPCNIYYNSTEYSTSNKVRFIYYANAINNKSTIYKGFTYNDRLNTIYISASKPKEINDINSYNSIVYGDTYIQMYSTLNSMWPQNELTPSDDDKIDGNFSQFLFFPIETTHNLLNNNKLTLNFTPSITDTTLDINDTLPVPTVRNNLGTIDYNDLASIRHNNGILTRRLTVYYGSGINSSLSNNYSTPEDYFNNGYNLEFDYSKIDDNGVLGRSISKITTVQDNIIKTSIAIGYSFYNNINTYNAVSGDNLLRQDTGIVSSSVPKIDGEELDSWSQFLLDDIFQIDSQYGKLINLVTYNDKLLTFQKSALGLLSVLDRTLVNEGDTSQLVLGTGGVLDRIDYISTTIGSVNSIYTIGNNGLYWYDYVNKSIIHFNQGLQNISENKVNSIFNNVDGKSPISLMWYNRHTNEILFKLNIDETFIYHNGIDYSLFKQKSLSYNESYNIFNGVLNTFPLFATSSISNLFGIDGPYSYPDEPEIGYYYGMFVYNSLATSTNFEEIRHTNPKITFVVNDNYKETKTFDMITYKLTSTPFSIRYTSGVNNEDRFKNYSINNFTINVSNDYQNSGDVPIILNNNMTYKERNYKVAIPRNANTTYGNNTIPVINQNRLFKERMRDNYLKIKLSSTGTDNIKLPYIITDYRISKR